MSEQPFGRGQANTLREIIHLATLAPSGHNTQPWLFKLGDNCVKIIPDLSRRLKAVDPDDHALYISIGCALENLLIAARCIGYHNETKYFPPDEPEECILVSLEKSEKQDDPLFSSISERQSTRCPYDGQLIPSEQLDRLIAAGNQSNVSLKLFTAPEKINSITELIKEANRIQFSDPDFIDELVSWIRFNKSEVAKYNDGLSYNVMSLPSVPRWLGNFIFKRFVSPDGEAKRCEAAVRSSSGLILFIAESNNKTSWVNLGQSFERVALTATSLQIKHAHLNMPCEVTSVRAKLKQYLELDSQEPLLLLRIGYAKPMPRSPRRPLSEVCL